MAGESHETEGLFASLKTLASTLAGVVQTRLELLSTDVAEERARLTSILVLVMIALFCLGVGAVLLTMLVVIVFWDTHRLAALGGLTLLFLGGGCVLWWQAMHKLRTKPRLFEASINELAKDREQLSSGSS